MFFGLHTPWLAVVVIIALWVIIALFITRSWRRDRLSAWAFVPYLAWVSFATLLTVSIAILN